VQQDTVGHPNHKDDPLYKIRGLLRHGVERLTERQQAKITAWLDAGDPKGEVNLTWQCYQQLRSIYQAAPVKGREIAAKVSRQLPQLPDPRSRPARRTLRAWKAQVLACFDTSGSPTAAPKPSTWSSRRSAGWRTASEISTYRLRIMLAADGRRPYRRRPTHA
jgi:transposase